MAAGLPPVEAEKVYRAAGDRLRQRIWDPIAGYLTDATNVLVVPDGALNLVSFAALPTRNGHYLGERYVLHYASTERDLIEPESSPSSHGLLAVGGPAFGGSPPLTSVPQATTSAALRAACGDLHSVHFEALPGSQHEASQVARIWSDAFSTDSTGEAVTVLTGLAATKNAVKSAAVGRRVVHLATHGFFLGASCGPQTGGTRAIGGISTPATSGRTGTIENPLLLSGLAFAGANRRASGKSDEDDGILTAEEVAGLNLQGAEWAVLSACDTGLGEIKAGEGVFGLRRAFQIAGARTVIMSMWAVDDQAAQAWMSALYDGRFNKHLSTSDAVHEATLSVLRARRARGQSTHPFYWAGFVAAGDWR
jgi:CHAT domain-containing protein